MFPQRIQTKVTFGWLFLFGKEVMGMAATRLIALHVNKGKTVAQCLADRTDYSQNAAKTNDGEFISSYECDPKTADEEFLLTKRQYQHITGRQQKNNIIAYQIRQSFKPGEITPEEANQVGYETAMRWTKGKHAFIVATHIDKSHTLLISQWRYLMCRRVWCGRQEELFREVRL